jgi:hypothetical protein
MIMSFKSWLTKAGEDFKKGIGFLLTNPTASALETTAIDVFAPGLGPVFATTKAACVLAEQNAAAIGKQSGSGLQKSAAVVQITGNLIKTGLDDAGMDSTDAGIQKWIDAVVTVLKAAPAIAA